MKIDLMGTLENLFALGAALIGTLLIAIIIAAMAYIIEHKKAHLKQVARAMGKFPNQISGRFTELKAENIIEDTGERDEGCTVYRLKVNQLTIF